MGRNNAASEYEERVLEQQDLIQVENDISELMAQIEDLNLDLLHLRGIRKLLLSSKAAQ